MGTNLRQALKRRRQVGHGNRLFSKQLETTSNKSGMRWRILWAQNRCGMRSGEIFPLNHTTLSGYGQWIRPTLCKAISAAQKILGYKRGWPPFSVYDNIGDIYVEHYSITASHHFRQDILSRGWLLKYRGMFLWVSWNFLRLQAQGLHNEQGEGNITRGEAVKVRLFVHAKL